jgi:hypothetical protein
MCHPQNHAAQVAAWFTCVAMAAVDMEDLYNMHSLYELHAKNICEH